MHESARCPDDNMLGRLMAGELSGGERAEVERHLGGCSVCAGLIAECARVAPPRAIPERYQLGRRLGTGAMGEVWEAEDTLLGRRVALKFVRADSTSDRKHQARLAREARALARLRHRNVVAIHDLDQSGDGEIFVVLELIDGTTARVWRAAAPRTPAEILAVWRTVAGGLAAAHAAGIVHRDLKPENVFVASDGRVVLGDFGLASVAADVEMTTLTATGQVIGTPVYMPLEQLRGGEATPLSDQFALCVCIWEALVGTRPFRTTDTVAVLIGAMRSRPTLPLRHRSLCMVLARGLDPDPVNRWPDVAALIRALDRVVTQRRWLNASVIVVAAAIVALALLR